MDKSLDDVRLLLLYATYKWLTLSPSQIIAARPKPARKTSSRRGVGRVEALGRKDPVVSARARYTTSTPGTGKTSPAPGQTAEKIIVSNLPTDVNETQIKVCSRFFSDSFRSCCSLAVFDRNCSILLLGPSKTSPFTTIPLVAQRELPISFSREREMEPKPTNSTTTA